MRRILIGLVAAGILGGAMPVLAQDEIIVTGMRRLSPDNGSVHPLDVRTATAAAIPPAAAQMLRRTADFAVQQVVVVSDTVEEADADKEVRAMTRKAIDLSAASGVQLASGELVVEPLTAGNYTDLKIEEIDEGEIDGQAVKFLVKVPLAPGIDAKAALVKIDKFIKAVPAVGRAEIKAYSELTLSVVDPEQYRGAIIDLVAKDTAGTSARFGAGYGVEVTGLDKPVQWKRASLTEVQLFLPADSKVRPRN
ncbi:TonB-dependent receptor [Sphingomonas koreensis]|uniref:TonB-dependent receptor n=1 Tax=Sphingomonas koreensis TaxID=93064 RepID=A0A430G6U2_9SPHN|nr:TonB-dependent receptor [Sphingomonas koreensis]RSY88681.1 TonB-dependent receptor [Sphingomonas koreensis]